MDGVGQRNDKSYRRGLVLGLTIAETMILVIFALLLALTSTLSVREERIARLEKLVQATNLESRLTEVIQKQYPHAVTFDDYFKELKQAFEAVEEMKKITAEAVDTKTLLADARLGKKIHQAAEKAGQSVDAYSQKLLEEVSEKKAKGWPPFINLSEAGGYYFESGSAQLKAEFQQALETTTVETLKKIIDQYDVNVVEVIGHTDEVHKKGASNLDSRLIAAGSGLDPISSLASCDNSGLGMARAVSVVKVLRADPRLSGVTILPFSGAQMIEPIDTPATGKLSGDRPTRRRIEIRVRKSTGESNVQ